EALDRGQPMPGKTREPRLRLAADDARSLGTRRGDAATLQPAAELARRDLHLGELGHAAQMSRPMLARNLETGIQFAQGGARDSRRQLRPAPARSRVGPSDVRGGRYPARE